MIFLEIKEAYVAFIASLPPFIATSLNLFALILLVSLYAILVWKFYRWISKKNILELNLNKYNRSQHPFLEKILAGFFYFLEYIIIIPVLVFIWFGIFTLFLVLLTENLPISSLLLISAVIIGAIRMTAYYREELSKELSKMLPITLLAVSILNPTFFKINRILANITEIPAFFHDILYYLLFIVILEVVLRFFEFMFSLFKLKESVPEQAVDQS